MEKLVSVIIPAYNHEKYIGDAINSVLNQTYKNIELIVEDDLSTNNTVKEIKKIKDKRLKTIFSKKNKGPVRTMNHLLSMCKGDYIAILGSDDIWYPEKLEKQLKYFSKKNIGAVFSMMDVIDENNNISSDDELLNTKVFNKNNMSQAERMRLLFEKGNHLCHPTSIITREAFEKIGYFNLAYKQLHDFDYWIRLVNEYDIYIVPEKLIGYRRFNNKKNLSAINTNTVSIINEEYSILKNELTIIKDKLFKEGFRDLFVNSNSSSKDELLCEKMILLRNLDFCGVNNKFYALDFLSKIENNHLFDLLEEKYNYSLNDFYQENSKIYEFYTPSMLMKNQKEINKLVNDKKTIDDEYIKMSNELNSIYNSKSWKITKPLRKITERKKK